MRASSTEQNALLHLGVAYGVNVGFSLLAWWLAGYGHALPIFGIGALVSTVLAAGLGYYIFRSLVWTVVLVTVLRVGQYAAMVAA